MTIIGPVAIASISVPAESIVVHQSQPPRRCACIDVRARRDRTRRAPSGLGVCTVTGRRIDRPALGTGPMIAGAMGDVVDRDPGRERAGGEHGPQLHHQRTAGARADTRERVGRGGRGVRAGGSAEPERPDHRIRQHRGHRLAQRRPRAVDELADRALGQPHPRRDPRPRDPVQGGADQCIALTRGERVELRQRRAGRRAPLHKLLQRLAAAGLVGQRRLHRPLRAVCGIADDRMQPAPQMGDVGAGAQRRPCVEERLLHDVVGAAVRHQPTGVRE
jgi:hypothetical protein